MSKQFQRETLSTHFAANLYSFFSQLSRLGLVDRTSGRQSRRRPSMADNYRVGQNKMSHQTKCNFSTIDRDFLAKISRFKVERFSNL